MTEYRVNRAAVTAARKLIDDGRTDTTTAWSDAAPTTDQENAHIDRHGYASYGEWHLAVDPGAAEETKGRYAFPIGDFRRVNRAALVHAKQRAVQNDHDEIARAADRLIRRLDELSG